MKHFIILCSLIGSALISFTLVAEQGSQQHFQQDPQQNFQTEQEQFSEAELAQMLAPIALYPDSLLTHILIAATYPIEIVEAHRWLRKNKTLNADQISQSVADFNWDASVKALIPFERVLSRLSDDLTWSRQLGDAFLQDEARLLASIQALRKQAELAGSLDKMANMDVSYEENNIIIEPVEKEIVYVPYYDTRMVYGAWHWSLYPPVYWPAHHGVYVNHHRPFSWHSGIHISFNYFFSAFHWHNRHVVVVNPHRSHYYRPHSSITSGGYAKRWSHQVAHRKGVAYRTKHVSKKYHSNRVKVHDARKPLHFTKQSSAHKSNVKLHKNQHHVNKSLSAKHHAVNKRKTYEAHTNNKTNSHAVPKQYLTNVKPTEHRQKMHSPKMHSPKTHKPKVHKQKTTYHHNSNSKNKMHSNKKQSRRHSPMKKQH
ncbi:MAG: DUF3300 domain-containing protein [Colwellia sp.]|nr:DUF3300 domain-containing protein [Colwellia sp.]